MKKILLLSLLTISSYIGAAQEELEDAVSYGEMQDVLNLLNADAKGDFTPKSLGEALGFSHDLPIAELLVLRGADITGQTFAALHEQSASGRTDIVQLLLQHKASIDQVDDGDGNTALHLAKMNGELETVRLLLQHRASTVIANSHGYTARTIPFKASSQEDQKAITELLRDTRTIVTGKRKLPRK